ncbi:DUF1826 domain-containing protein [Modicisalibacter coralii]|uniref:DUF1826 domain-containing protein n=1 Tax=Modicisalibacter coralii TaxID=2304602 RepID=UPI001F31BE2F|nr:DUF1826 domain-containing protein [Halomonas coralii]
MPMTAHARTQRPTHLAGSGAEHWAIDQESDVLPRIFEDGITIAVMQRALSTTLQAGIDAQCRTAHAWQIAWWGDPGEDALRQELFDRLPAPRLAEALVEDVTTLATAMGCLFATDTVGVRLRLLDAAMCPRFHCDNLPVRLVTTYSGPGSEWLPDHAVERAGLGAPRPDKPDVVADAAAIERLRAGDLALLKGSGWVGNEQRGLVHRSPALAPGQKRLMLSIDPA